MPAKTMMPRLTIDEQQEEMIPLKEVRRQELEEGTAENAEAVLAWRRGAEMVVSGGSISASIRDIIRAKIDRSNDSLSWDDFEIDCQTLAEVSTPTAKELLDDDKSSALFNDTGAKEQAAHARVTALREELKAAEKLAFDLGRKLMDDGRERGRLLRVKRANPRLFAGIATAFAGKNLGREPDRHYEAPIFGTEDRVWNGKPLSEHVNPKKKGAAR